MNSGLNKQVNREHYSFEKYFYKGRWMSYYYQFKEIIKVEGVKSVLEIGPGTNLIKDLIIGLDLKKINYLNYI